jgi:hypothetical protein
LKVLVKNIASKIIPLLMVGIMALLISNKILYIHSHKLGDGSVITHSHPFNKTQDPAPFKSHHHTKGEFLFFENLYVLFFVLFLIVPFLLVFKEMLFFIKNVKLWTKSIFSPQLGRAPPLS